MNETKSIAMPRRTVSLAAAAGLALAGTITLGSAQMAQAEVMQQGDKVWVCKFVGKPFESELLKGGKNPIEVGWPSADKDKNGKVSVGDEFADAQGQSVVVQINGADPGVKACMKTPPPTTTTKPPKTTTSTPPATTTSKTTTSTTSPPPTTTSTTVPPSGAGGGVVPGVGAPDTGGTGGSSPAGTLLGTGLLLAAGGVLASEAFRRRRELNQA